MNPETMQAAMKQHNEIVDEMNAIGDFLNQRLAQKPEGERQAGVALQGIAMGTLYAQLVGSQNEKGGYVLEQAVIQTLSFVEAGRLGLLKESETNPNLTDSAATQAATAATQPEARG